MYSIPCILYPVTESMSDTQKIKEKLDIVDFIGEYIQLKTAGINHKGLCPFHQEKTPSFMVNRERQSWHCFGCSKGGDIFSFVEEIEGMEFIEALKFLATKAGIDLEFSVQDKVKSSQKNRIKEINLQAARFFHNFLLKIDISRDAREYLEKRGLSQKTIEEWQIGFVPDQWDLLTKYMLKKGHAIDDLVASGFTIKRDGADANSGRGFYDRFRGRIMFPIRDVHGVVVGFTGRVLIETDRSGGKYVNTPQTLVYDKSNVVFGLDQGKKEARNKDFIVLVEGQTDTISSHQAGLSNVVATSGTALTEKQIKLIKRYTSNIRMAFDADDAGFAAAKRGIDLALEAGLSVKVIIIPEGAGKDPDECIKKDQQIWFNCVDSAKDVMDWYFDRVFTKFDKTDLQQKQKIANILLDEISRIPYAVEKDHWMKELSVRLGVEIEVLKQDINRIVNNKKTIGAQTAGVQEKRQIDKTPRYQLMIESLLSLILRFPEVASKSWSEIEKIDFSTSKYLPLYLELKKQYNTDKSINVDNLRDLLHKDNSENPVDILLMKAELDFLAVRGKEIEQELEKLINQISKSFRKSKQKELEIEIAQAEKQGNKELLIKLLKEFNDLISKK